MRYTTAVGFSRHGLDEDVAQLIARGYVPWGGVCVLWTASGMQLYQAMVKQ